MAEDLRFNSHNDGCPVSELHERAGLTSGSENGEDGDETDNELSTRMYQQLATLKHFSEYPCSNKGLSRVCIEAKDRRSLMDATRQATALLIGSMAFLLSAALLVIAYTAVCCVFVGKDFTESKVGGYVFERSPYWQHAFRGPVEILLQVCEVALVGLRACLAWVAWRVNSILNALHIACVSGILLFCDTAAVVFRSPWPILVLQLVLWVILIAAAIVVIDVCLVFMCRKLNRCVVERRCSALFELSEMQGRRSARYFCSQFFAVQHMVETFLLPPDTASQGPPHEASGGRDCPPAGIDGRAEARAPSGVIIGSRHAHRRAMRQTNEPGIPGAPPTDDISAALSAERHHAGFFDFVVGLFRRILPAYLIRGIAKVMRPASSPPRERTCWISQPKDIGVGGQASEVELLAMQSHQQATVATSPAQSRATSPRSDEFSLDSEESSHSASETSRGNEHLTESADGPADDGDDEWCFVAVERPQTTVQIG